MGNEGPPTGRKRLHVYTRVSIAFALVAFLFNVLVVVLCAARSPACGIMALRSIPTTLLCGLITFCLGIDAAVKYKWPGKTAYEHARKPGGRDLALVAVAVGLTVVNLVFLVAWMLHVK